MTNQLDIDFSAPAAPLAVIHGDSLTREESAVLRLLEGHRGHENAITGERIEEQLGMKKDEPRRVVAHLRKRHKVLIGATNAKPQGYFLAVTDQDAELAFRNFRTRAMALLSIEAEFRKISVDEVYGQAKMDLEAQIK